jgi:hypothetical protein
MHGAKVEGDGAGLGHGRQVDASLSAEQRGR